MTYREAYKQSKQWQRKASLISMYHHKMMIKKGKWNCRKTAEYFSISVGKVSEDIKIALNMGKVRDCANRHDALFILK